RSSRATKHSRQARSLIDSLAAGSFCGVRACKCLVKSDYWRFKSSKLTNALLRSLVLAMPSAYEHPRRKIAVENAMKITKRQTKLTAIWSDRLNLHLRPIQSPLSTRVH